MTRPLTEDDLLEFKRLVRWLTGVTLTQMDAAKELEDLRARYTAPAPGLPPAPDEWIPWSGGENPVPGKTVTVRLGECYVSPVPLPSDVWKWQHLDLPDDIVAYRVVE
jgi:hypothetical protein